MQLTKEQEKVLQSQVKDLVVSASAGSGKTFVVIEKLIHLICDEKVPVDKILVLTFTKAASNEMKARLYNAILQKPYSKYLVDQIDSLALADISTIDSFCEKIIKRNINKLNLDENFEILDEKSSKNLKNLAFLRTFQYFSQNQPDTFEEIYFAFKRNKQAIKECILSLQEFLSSCEDKENLLKEFEQTLKEKDEKADKYLIALIKNYFYLADFQLNMLCNSSNKNVENIASKLKEIVSQDFNKDIYDLSIKINSFLPLPAMRGKMEENDKAILNKAKEFIKEGLKITQNWSFITCELKNKASSGVLVKAIISFYKHYIDLYEKIKSKRDGLDFADIESYAMQLLKDEEVKKALQEKYQYIFIDEYQDTNRLQQSILNPIAQSGHFVAVGDIKQGIYGFRNARMEIMKEDIENFKTKDDGDALFLTGNFRTNKNILDFVNLVFEKIMTNESVGIDYKSTSMLQGLKHFEDTTLPCVAVDVIIDKKEEEQAAPAVYSVKEDVIGQDDKFKYEILAIQNRIEQALESQIYDAKQEKFRKVNFSDITLVFRNRSALMKDAYNYFINKGLPINADIKDNLLEDGEISVIYSLLKLTLNFKDDISLVSVLNSHFGGFSVEELAQLRLNADKESKYFYQIIQNSNEEKVVKFKNMVSEFKFDIQIFGTIKALNKLFNKYDYYSYLSSLINSHEKLGNINSLFKLIRSSHLDDNVSQLTTQLEEAVESKSSAGGNAITMTTIHATKGLEYPIVILCGAGESLTKPYIKNYCISEKFGLSSYVNDFDNLIRVPSAAFVAGKIEKQRREFIDEMMIFYVAMTRAQNHLFIIGSGKEKDYSFDEINKQNSYLKMIFYALGENCTSQLFSQGRLIKGKCEFNVFDEFEEVSSVEEKTTAKNMAFKKEIEAYNNFVYPYKDYCKLAFKNSVTSSIKLEEIEKQRKVENQSVTSSQEAVDRGNAYHEALKNLDFEKIENIEDLKNELEKIKDKMTEGYISLLDNQTLLNNIKIIKSLTEGKKLYKEKEFIMQCSLAEMGITKPNESNDDNIIIQGIIDLFAMGDEIVLIDYKYSSSSAGALKNRYFKQIELYSKALEKAFNQKITKRYLLSLKNAEVISL